MDATPFRVEEDQGNRQDSPASVEGGQASYAPPMNESEPAAGGAIDILQQLAEALQRAAQLAAVAPQRSAIERMARYRSVDFLGRKEDEPSMAENWLERTERMLVQMHCTPDESLEQNKPRSLLASKISSTYSIRNINLLPLTFRYIH